MQYRGPAQPSFPFPPSSSLLRPLRLPLPPLRSVLHPPPPWGEGDVGCFSPADRVGRDSLWLVVGGLLFGFVSVRHRSLLFVLVGRKKKQMKWRSLGLEEPKCFMACTGPILHQHVDDGTYCLRVSWSLAGTSPTSGDWLSWCAGARGGHGR